MGIGVAVHAAGVRAVNLLPEGWTVPDRASEFLQLVGLLAQRAMPDDTVAVGLRAESKHTNHRGVVHGAVLSPLADIALGRSAATVGAPGASWVTTSLTVDYIAPATEGSWLAAAATVQRAGWRLAFTHGLITADDILVAQSSALFSAV